MNQVPATDISSHSFHCFAWLAQHWIRSGHSISVRSRLRRVDSGRDAALSRGKRVALRVRTARRIRKDAVRTHEDGAQFQSAAGRIADALAPGHDGQTAKQFNSAFQVLSASISFHLLHQRLLTLRYFAVLLVLSCCAFASLALFVSLDWFGRFLAMFAI